jgi:hypothetical protein
VSGDERGILPPRADRSDPPSAWADAAPLGGEVFWRPVLAEGGTVAVAGPGIFWHWCTEIDRWRAAVPRLHALVSLQPLHLEPSLLWPCCGKHGFVRDGAWVEA